VFAMEEGVSSTSAMTLVINDKGAWFFLDTHCQVDPTAEQIVEATVQAALRMTLFGIVPKVALLSHSNFGSHTDASAVKMRRVRELLVARDPHMEVEGEMQADAAWNEDLRLRMFPHSKLKGRANLVVMPNLSSANIAYNMVRVMTDGVAIGPILMGVASPAHILTPASTVRRVVNMTAIAAVEAQIRAKRGSEMKG
jgi:malate dehydrogenase (oxaloacetate-decarboxylating)(NADP+)